MTRRLWRVFNRVFVAHSRKAVPKERRQRQRMCGAAAVRAPDAGVVGGRRVRGTDWTDRILAETIRQRGNRVVTNQQIVHWS